MDNYRNRDSAVEREIAAYLDENFYPKIGAIAVRHSDKITQMSGVDVTLSFKKLTKVAVDEKALSHYINKDIPTFAFELSFLNKNNIIEGWFTDDSKITEYYMLIWLWAKNDWDITRKDITSVEIYLISRKSILDYLAKREFSRFLLRKKAESLRDSGIGGAIEKGKHDGFYFFLTKTLVEQPINIVIKKSVLKTLALYRFSNKKG